MIQLEILYSLLNTVLRRVVMNHNFMKHQLMRYITSKIVMAVCQKKIVRSMTFDVFRDIASVHRTRRLHHIIFIIIIDQRVIQIFPLASVHMYDIK